MNTPETTTLPIPPDLFSAIAGLGGFALFVLIVYGALIPVGHSHVAPLERVKERLGMAGLNSGLFLIALALWGAIFLSLAIGLIWLIWEMIWMSVPEATRATWDFRFALARLAGMTATLGAVVALPFTLVRVRLNAEQTRTAQEGLITDRVNKAVEGLGADKVVKRQRRRSNGMLAYVNVNEQPDYSQPIMEEVTEPNLEVRIGSIYALERIAQDSERDHQNTIDILCTYVRQNAPVASAKKSPHEIFYNLHRGSEGAPPLNAHEIFETEEYQAANSIGINPTELDQRSLEDWAHTLPAIRSDIQVALDVLGRRTTKERENHEGFRLDLSNTCLQRGRLVGNFQKTKFKNARLDGCELLGAFDSSDFSSATLQAAHAGHVSCTRCNFTWSNLSGSLLEAATLSDSRYWFALMAHTNMNGTTALKCDFFGAEPHHVYFNFGADASFSRFSSTKPEEFRGLEASQTKGLWATNIAPSPSLKRGLFHKISEEFVAELDDRRSWWAYLKKIGLATSKPI